MKKKKKLARRKPKPKTPRKGSVLRTKKVVKDNFNPDNIFDSSTGKTNALFIPK